MRRKFRKNQKVSKYFEHDDDHDDDHDVEHFKNYDQKQSFADVLQIGILKRFSIFTRSAGEGSRPLLFLSTTSTRSRRLLHLFTICI